MRIEKLINDLIKKSKEYNIEFDGNSYNEKTGQLTGDFYTKDMIQDFMSDIISILNEVDLSITNGFRIDPIDESLYSDEHEPELTTRIYFNTR